MKNKTTIRLDMSIELEVSDVLLAKVSDKDKLKHYILTNAFKNQNRTLISAKLVR